MPGKSLFVFLPLALTLGLNAQPDRITTQIDQTRAVALQGNLRPEIGPQNDLGKVEPQFPVAAMTLLLKQSPSQQAALRQLLEDQQNPASPEYHQWLTPGQFGDRFGIGPTDIGKIAAWLRSQGFAVGTAAHSRTSIVFSGSASQVENAFHTEIHRYRVQNETHFANTRVPSIPMALEEVVANIDGLDDFVPEPPISPEITSSTGKHTLAPDDLATIYDIAPLYKAGIDGAGQKIVVVGETAFDVDTPSDFATFRAKFNLPPNVPQVVLDPDYSDPGVSTSDLSEMHLDIEWSGSVARNATIIYVYSGSVMHAVQYAIDNNLAPVITMSYYMGCEAAESGNIAYYQALGQQANAQGITWMNGAGDTGTAGCDTKGTAAENGLGIHFPASLPEITAVGGTEFNEQEGSYWSATNTANGASTLSYIPEMVWNDTAGTVSGAGGGGKSIYFPKPAWQIGPGVPNDNARDIPDVAMPASAAHDGYYLFKDGQVLTIGGCSAANPVFAGIVVLLNQYLISHGIQSKPGLGNINPMLYHLAQIAPGVFHDIVTGSNIVPCAAGSPDCSTGSFGYSAGPGYDQASGPGSVDAAKLLSEWAEPVPPTRPLGRRP